MATLLFYVYLNKHRLCMALTTTVKEFVKTIRWRCFELCCHLYLLYPALLFQILQH